MVIMVSYQGEGKIMALDQPTEAYRSLFTKLIDNWTDKVNQKEGASLSNFIEAKEALDAEFSAFQEASQCMDLDAYLACVKFHSDYVFEQAKENIHVIKEYQAYLAHLASFLKSADKKMDAINKQFGLHLIANPNDAKAEILSKAINHYFQVVNLIPSAQDVL